MRNRKIEKIMETEDNDERYLLISRYKRRNIEENLKVELTEMENKIYKKNRDPIINLIMKEKYSVLKRLLEDGLRVRWEKYIFNRNPPLHIAIENGDSKLVKLLIENGYPIWLINRNNLTPLEICCRDKDPGMIKLMIKYGALPNKILYLREGSKDKLFFHSNIDFLIMAKKLLNGVEIKKKRTLDLIGYDNYNWDDFLDGLEKYIKKNCNDLVDLYKKVSENRRNKNMEDYLIFWSIFNFNFNVECESYFMLELKYNNRLFKYLDDGMERLESKFYRDYIKIYPKEYLDVILKKFKKYNL